MKDKLMSQKNPIQPELSQAELDGLIERVERAIENELSLSVDDMKLLLLAIHSLAMLQQTIEDKDITLYKLRKLLGMVQQSEKRGLDNRSASTPRTRKNNVNKTPKKRTMRPPTVEHHALTDFQKGDSCPDCQRGKFYKFEPARLLRITGHGPFEAIQHISERLRCNACQVMRTAPLPDAVLEDGEANQQYGYSARSLMAINKFYSGLPYHHQGNVSNLFGYPISASTVFDQCEWLADAAMPVYYELKKIASNAQVFLLDDTPHRILEQQPEERANRRGSGTRIRTGVYSSGIVAYTQTHQEIVLFETSLGHAGEFIDDLLKKRDNTLPMPIVMSDALSSNTPTVIAVYQAYCNAHARREFFDIQHLKPEMIEWLLDRYGKIWENEAWIKEKNLDRETRLVYHQQHSKPVMEEIKRWAMSEQKAETFEEHSAFGKAIHYLLRHFDKLTCFYQMLDVPLDNNRMEETLKLIIRSRKTCHFFKTVNGAGVANVLTSLIGTGMRADINLFDYLTVLQRYAREVRDHPNAWLPWNYLEAVVEQQGKLKS
jgi:transposase